MLKEKVFAIVCLVFAAAAANAADCSVAMKEPRHRDVGVSREGLVLEWELIEGYPTYKVEVSTDPSFASSLTLIQLAPKNCGCPDGCKCAAPPPAPFVIVPGDFENAVTAKYKIARPDDKPLDANTIYHWRVTALGGNGECPVRISEVRRFRTARDVNEILSPGEGWSLAEGLDGKKVKEPAKFAWTRTLDDDTGENDDAYTARFGLKYTRETGRLGPLDDAAFTGGLFGVLNDHNDTADTALGIAAGIIHVVSFGSEATGMSNEYKLKFEGDQDFDTKKAFAEGTFTFASGNPKLHMGTAPTTNGPIQWLWEPTIITVYGRTIEKGTSTETDDTVLRLGARVDFDFRLLAISEMLNAPTSVTVTNTGYYLPNEEDKKYRNLFSAALDVAIAEGFTVGFEFNHGAEAPEFERTHSLGLTIGVKF